MAHSKTFTENSYKRLSRLSTLEGVAKHATFKVREASRFAFGLSEGSCFCPAEGLAKAKAFANLSAKRDTSLTWLCDDGAKSIGEILQKGLKTFSLRIRRFVAEGTIVNLSFR